MNVLKEVEHNGHMTLVVTDKDGLFIERLEMMRYYVSKLNESIEKLTNEEILKINIKTLGKNYPGMYDQIYGMPTNE